MQSRLRLAFHEEMRYVILVTESGTDSMQSLGRAWLRASDVTRAADLFGRGSAPLAGAVNFYAPDFSLRAEQPWYWGQSSSPELFPRPEPWPKIHRRVPAQATVFFHQHAEIMNGIAAGQWQKIVPWVRDQLHFETVPSVRALPCAEIPLGQHAYAWEWDDEGLCGVTPEQLFRVRGQKLTTMALAGTGLSDGPSLLDDQKERLEHELVIEHIVRELGRWGQVDVGQTQERVYGILKHLHTPIEMQLQRPVKFSELVSALHPTAALGGWPRVAALAWLETQDEAAQRGRFGAPFGVECNGDMDCVVAIRGIQWRGANAMISAGCGVVAGSRADREWNELQLKLRATQRALGLAVE